MFLGSFCYFGIFTPYPVERVYATSAQILPLPTLTPTPTPKYVNRYAGDKYADYIWSKWAPHGNRAQAVALCTNIAEGHLDDSAYNVNKDGSNDKGCWQWNSIHNLPDSLTMDCIKATDYTYAVWEKRLNMGITDGFQGMWYGYGSKNFNICMSNSLQ